MQKAARHFSELGYTVVTPDNRAHGESDGSYIGMGWLDRLDLLLWIDQIISEDPLAEIVLYGVSMGGAAVMMTAGEALPSAVKAIIEDCGYTSVYDMFKKSAGLPLRSAGIPVFSHSRRHDRNPRGLSFQGSQRAETAGKRGGADDVHPWRQRHLCADRHGLQGLRGLSYRKRIISH